MSKLTHIDETGRAAIVDVSGKDMTFRRAVAQGSVKMTQETLELVKQGANKKGHVQSVAELAGIMGAKKTSDLIPLCHPLALSKVSVELTPDAADSLILIEATAKVTGQTGVEMEALTAVSVAALTIYDMCKAVDKAMRIENIRLVYKDGGRSGVYEAQ